MPYDEDYVREGHEDYVKEGQLKGANLTNVEKVTRNLPTMAEDRLARIANIAKITNSTNNKEQTFLPNLLSRFARKFLLTLSIVDISADN